MAPEAGEEELLKGRYVERVEVSMVLLQATVLDRRGEIVVGLEPGDFKLLEDGVPQKISAFGTSDDQPLKVAFLLDVSGSMALRGKLDRARSAIHRFVDGLTSYDELALLIFADGEVVVKKGFSRNRWDFFRGLDPLEAYGRTALRDALAAAPEIIDGASPGRKALILITDGVDNASEMTVVEAIQAARRVPVPIFSIGLTDLPGEMREERRPDSAGRSFLEVLAAFGEETGGALTPVFTEDEMQDAVSLVERRMRGQYLIGYSSLSGRSSGEFRRISLTTRKRGRQVITREGYYPGGAAGD
jgi:VWFA-related protein